MHSCDTFISYLTSFTEVMRVFQEPARMASCLGISNDACESDGWRCTRVWVCRLFSLCAFVCPRWMWCHPCLLHCCIVLSSTCWIWALSCGGGGTAYSLSQPAPHITPQPHPHAGLDYLLTPVNAYVIPFSNLHTNGSNNGHLRLQLWRTCTCVFPFMATLFFYSTTSLKEIL